MHNFFAVFLYLLIHIAATFSRFFPHKGIFSFFFSICGKKKEDLL